MDDPMASVIEFAANRDPIALTNIYNMQEQSNELNDKLFHHHEKEMEASAQLITEWDNNILSGLRCGSCWLRNYDCYCSYVSHRRSLLDLMCKNNLHVHIFMYYHYKEIGRSANTAHLLELLIPKSKITRIIYGTDLLKEKTMVEMIINESAGKDIKTCILYPTKTSELLSNWIKINAIKTVETSNNVESYDNSDNNTKMNIIALDGTYGQAEKQYKYLKKVLTLAGIISIPVVKLDLENGYCMSMMTGLMSQVGKEKICTFQACIMAMQQAGVPDEITAMLLHELDLWIKHLLTSKIKIGKSKIRKIENMPEESKLLNTISQFLYYNPPPSSTEEANLRKMEKMYMFIINRKLEDIRAIFNNHNRGERAPSIKLKKTKKYAVYSNEK